MKRIGANMSKLYGSISGDGRSKSNATQCATNHIRATAQSWQGSVGVNLDYIDGKLYFAVHFGEGSTAYPGSILIASGEIVDGKPVLEQSALVAALIAAQDALVTLSTPDVPGDMPEPLLEQIAAALAEAQGEQ